MYHNTQVSYKQMQFKNVCHSYVHQYHTYMEKIHSSIIQPKGCREYECVNMQNPFKIISKDWSNKQKESLFFQQLLSIHWLMCIIFELLPPMYNVFWHHMYSYWLNFGKAFHKQKC